MRSNRDGAQIDKDKEPSRLHEGGAFDRLLRKIEEAAKGGRRGSSKLRHETYVEQFRLLMAHPIRPRPYPAFTAQAYISRVFAQMKAKTSLLPLEGEQKREVLMAARNFHEWLANLTADFREYMDVIRYWQDPSNHLHEDEDPVRFDRTCSQLDQLLVTYETRIESGEIPWLPRQWKSHGSGPTDSPDLDVIQYVRHWLGRVLARGPDYDVGELER